MQKRQYFYDKQIRRYLTQIIRLFSGFQIRYLKQGDDGNAVERFRTVPCIWGEMSRIGASWLTENSENVASAAPVMSVTITSLSPSPEYRLSPFHQEDTHFIKKQQNPDGPGFINKPDTMYKVSQHMPVPYVMEFNLDILVTSTSQKLELLEQILSLFNPGFRMKSNSSPFDIGKYFEIRLENVQWTSRSVPQGTSTELDFATLGFSITPMYINVPSKIRKNTLIKRIITNVNVDGDPLETTLEDIISGDGHSFTESVVVTPTDYAFEIFKENGEFFGRVLDSANEYQPWDDVFDAYGRSDEGDTWIRARRTEDFDDDNYDIYMTFQLTNDDTVIKLNFDEDSFKVTDIDPIDKIINPNKKTPEQFGNAYGTRYLLSVAIDDDNVTWGIEAPAMSIIESTENGWVITFDPTQDTDEHYVVNLTTGDQWYYDGISWSHYLIGTYQPRFWMFDVQSVNCG